MEKQHMSKFNRVLSAVEAASKWFYLFSAICLVSLFVIMTSDVLGRFLLNSPITGTAEVGTYFLAALVFLGLGYAQVTGRHVKLDLLTRHFPKMIRKILNITLLLVSAAFFAMMTRQTSLIAYKDWQMQVLFSGSAIDLPIWIISFAASLGCLLLVIVLLAQVTRKLYTVESTEQK